MTDTDLIYQSSKTYAHSVGLSCSFRQWRATHSHCSKLHGYALKVELIWEGDLDERNWVMDFGALKPVKAFLEETFDHKTIVAEDDPQLSALQVFNEVTHMMDIKVLPGVGAEKFAEYIFRMVSESVSLPVDAKSNAKLKSVQVWEHEGNSAKVIRK